MVTIKMESDGVTESLTKLDEKISVYRSSVVSATAQFSEFQNALTGEAYTALSSQMTKTLEKQQLLVAECLTLTKQLKSFTEEISQAEANVTFE